MDKSQNIQKFRPPILESYIIYILTCVAYTNCFSLIPSKNFMATSSVGSAFYFTARTINFIIYLKKEKNSLNDWNLELHFVIWREKFARVFVHPPEVELFTYRTSGTSNNNTAFISINWLFHTKLIVGRCSGLMQGWFTSGITLNLKRTKISLFDWIKKFTFTIWREKIQCSFLLNNLFIYSK